jgi:hypothetical protein
MSTFNIADVTDFLTPASVFTREDGREARVLFVTNMALPEKLKKQFPPQVVYADENDNILSCDIDRFLNKRTFFNVQPELEARLNNLLAAPASDSGEDVLDLMGDDDLTLTDDGDGDLDLSAMERDAGIGSNDSEDIDSQDPIVVFSPRNADLPSVFDIDTLTAAVASYQQQPSADLSAVQHVLFIKAEAGIDATVLDAVFSPANEARNQTLEFAVDAYGTGTMHSVNWDTFVGIYPCVFYGSRMFQVIFSVANASASLADAAGIVQLSHAEGETGNTDFASALESTTEDATDANGVTDVAFTEAAAPVAAPVAPQAQPQTIQVKVATSTQAPNAMQAAQTTAMAQALAAATQAAAQAAQ